MFRILLPVQIQLFPIILPFSLKNSSRGGEIGFSPLPGEAYQQAAEKMTCGQRCLCSCGAISDPDSSSLVSQRQSSIGDLSQEMHDT